MGSKLGAGKGISKITIKKIRLPVESIGSCMKSTCEITGILADDLCQRCWDLTEDIPKIRRRKYREQLTT